MEDKYMDELMADMEQEKKRNAFAVKACYTIIGSGVALVLNCLGKGAWLDAITCGLACGVSALIFGLET